jgi:hypothetical protein
VSSVASRIGIKFRRMDTNTIIAFAVDKGFKNVLFYKISTDLLADPDGSSGSEPMPSNVTSKNGHMQELER